METGRDKSCCLRLQERERLTDACQTRDQLLEQVLVRDVDAGTFLWVRRIGHVGVLGTEIGDHSFLFIEERGEEIEEFIPLGTLIFQRENRDNDCEDLQVEHEVVKMLGGVLLTHNLKARLLQPLEIELDKASQEIEAVLDRLDFTHDQFDHFKWIPLLVQLLDHMRFLHQNRMDERHQFMLKCLSRFQKLTMEEPSIVNIERFLALGLLLTFLLSLVEFLLPPSLRLTKAKHFNQQLHHQTLDILCSDHGISQQGAVLVYLQVGAI